MTVFVPGIHVCILYSFLFILSPAVVACLHSIYGLVAVSVYSGSRWLKSELEMNVVEKLKAT